MFVSVPLLCYPAQIEKKITTLFLEGSYEDYLDFVLTQPKEKRLEWKQFKEIRELGNKNLLDLKNCDPNLVSLFCLARENKVEEMFQKLDDSSILEMDEKSLDVAFFMHMVKIGETAPGSFTREVYLDMMRMKRALSFLKKGGGKEAFSYYQSRLASLLDLDTGSLLGRYLLKSAMQKGIYTAEEIRSVKKDLLALPAEELRILIRGEHEEVCPRSANQPRLQYHQ